jgi:serine/threonine-protein kinase RsbW
MSASHPLGTGGARQIQLSCDSRLDCTELLTRAVRGMVAAAGLPPRECAHVELAVAEAVNNVIRHAYHGEPGHPIELLFTLEDGRFTIEVSDTGTPMPERPSPVFDFDPQDVARLPEGGMGLFLIHSVMDEVEYRSRGGRNSLAMRRRLAA